MRRCLGFARIGVGMAVVLGLCSPSVEAAAAAPAPADVAGAVPRTATSPLTTSEATVAPAAGGDPLAEIVSLVPARLYDSRADAQTVDGASAGGGRLSVGQRIDVPVAGRGGVPATGAVAAVLNVTAVGAEAAGFATLFPCSDNVPLASSLNFWPAAPAIPNEVIAKLAPSGSVCVFTSQALDLVIDVVGYVPSTSSYRSLDPARLYDSRPGELTVDGSFAGAGRLSTGQRIELNVAGRGGVPVTGVGAAVLNFTAVGADVAGYATVFPCTAGVPLASSLNFWEGVSAIPNELIAKLSPAGSVCVYTSQAIDLVVDVVGYVPASSGYSSLDPARLYDSRPGEPTVDGAQAGGGRLATGQRIEVAIAGRGGVPATGAVAAVLNVTAVGAAAAGFVTVFPCGDTVPLASSLNSWSGASAIPNELVAKLSPAGSVCAFTSQPIDLVFDVVGYVPAPAAVDPPDEGPPDEDPPDEDPPPPPARGLSPGWHVVPDNVILTGPGQTKFVRLTHFGSDGEPSGRAVPGGLVVESNTDAGIATTIDSSGKITVTGGNTIGEEVATIVVEDTVVGPLWLTSARLVEGVQVVDESRIVFPRGADSSPEPFTLAEIGARLTVPSEGSNPFAGEAVMPYVLRGAAPLDGQVLLASGSVPMMGRVLDRPGLPTLERGGFALVSIELVPLTDVYAKLQTGLATADLLDLGVLDPVDANTIAPDPGDRNTADQQSLSIFGKECEGTGSIFAAAELKLAKFSADFPRVGDGVQAFVTDRNNAGLIMEFGWGIKAEFGPELKMQTAVSGKLTCDLLEKSIPIPVSGPLAPVVSFQLTMKLVLELEAKAGVGPAMTIGTNCTFEYEILLGFRWTKQSGYHDSYRNTDPSFECEGVFDTPEGLNGAGVPVGLELSATLKFAPSFELVIGGGVVAAFGELFDIEDLGTFKLLEGSLGVKGIAAFENTANVLANKKSSTKVELLGIGSLSVPIEPLDVIANDVLGLGISLSIDIFNFEFSGPEWAKASDAKKPESPVQGTVEGSPKTSPFEVEVGDMFTVELPIELDSDADFKLEPDGGTDFIKEGSGAFEDFDKFVWQASSSELKTSTMITEELCDEFGSGRTIGVVGRSEFGPLPIPSWAGEFEISCKTNIEFKPEEITVTREDDTATTTMEQSGFNDKAWELRPDGEVPDGYIVSVEPESGTFDSESVDIEVFVICDDDINEQNVVIYHPWVEGKEVGEGLAVELDCRTTFFRASPVEVTAPATITFETKGANDDLWKGFGEPASGFIKGDGSTSTNPSVLSTFIKDRGEPPCDTTWEPIEKTYTYSTSERGSDTVTVKYGEKHGKPPPCEPSECPPVPEDPELAAQLKPCPPPAPCPGCHGEPNLFGEPHIASFDRVSYDAQILGEYVLAETADGGIRIVARFQRASSGTAIPFKPTSTTALSFEIYGRQIEVYARNLRFYLDGNLLTLPSNVTTTVGDGITISNSGGVFRIVSPYLEAEITTFKSLMFGILEGLNLSTATPFTGQFTGMLGTDDGDTSNDLNRRDGTSITLAEARAHDVEMYSFTDSWRLTDQDDSPFTLAYAGFAEANEPRPDSAALAPYRAEALALLGALPAVCAGQFEDGARIIDILAIELAIGFEPEDLDDYTCRFEATGVVTLSAPAVPVLGALVTVDAVGLEPCTTTTDASGRYRCTLTPDVDEIGDGSAISFPMPVQVSAAPPGSTVVAVSAGGQFDAKPAFGFAASESVNLTMPASAVSTLHLGGTLTEFGVPRDPGTYLVLTGVNALDEVVLATEVYVNPSAAGVFTDEVVAIPASLDELTVTWDIGIDGQTQPSTVVTGFAAGVNEKEVVFDYSPPALDITGTALYNGANAPPFYIFAEIELGGGGTVTDHRYVDSIGPGGEYSTRLILPDDAVSVELKARHGDTRNEYVIETVVAPDDGLLAVDFDVITGAPVIHASGSMRLNGDPVTGGTYIRVDVTRDGDAPYTIRRLMPPNIAGTYDQTFALADDATTATIALEIGAVAADRPRTTVTSLVDGVNEVQFDAELGAPTLNVSGVIDASGAPYRDVARFRVQATGAAAFDTLVDVQPRSDGAYDFSIQLPDGSTSATVTAQVGFSAADHDSAMVTPLVDGSNAVDLDASFPAVAIRVSGTWRDDGEPVTVRKFVLMRTFSSGGSLLATPTRTVTPDDEGAYSFDHYLPTTVARVDLAVRIRPSTHDQLYSPYAGLVAGLNTLTFNENFVPTVLALSGVFTAGDLPVAGLHYVDVDTTVSTLAGGTAIDHQLVRPFLNIEDGAYSIDVVLPRRALSVDLRARIGPTADDYPEMHVASITPAVPNPVVFSADIPTPVAIDFFAQLGAANDAPFTAPTSFRLRAFNAADAVVTDTSRSATPDALGEVDGFSSPLEFDQTVTKLVVDWAVGVAGEAPISRTFTDLAPGNNIVVFTATHAPPVITISGTSSINGSPDGGVFALDIDADRTGGATWAHTVNVNPNDVTGAFSSTLTLPRDSESVTVTADVGYAIEGASTTTTDVVEGPNAVPLDVVLVGPDLTVSGTVLVGDDPPTGDVAIDVIADADDHAPFTVSVSVDPASVTGAYDFDVVLPAWATEAELVAKLGPSAAGWPRQEVLALTPSHFDVTFDAAIDSQTLDVSGNVSIGGVPWPSNVRFVFSGETTTGGSLTDHVDVQPEPDGDYSFQYSPAADLVSVELRADTGSSPYAAPEQEFTGLTAGVNALDFDVQLEGRAIVTAGTITDRGTAVTAPTTLYIQTEDGIVPDPDLATLTIDPDANGHYDATFTVKADETVVELATQIGTFINDRAYRPFNLVAGVNNVTFNDNYLPPEIDVSGNIEVDGVPRDAVVTFQLTWIQRFDNPVGTFTQVRMVTVDPDPAGDYSFHAVGPQLADDVLIRAQVGSGANDHPSTTIDPLVPGNQSKTFDVDYFANRVSLSGTMHYRGNPVAIESFNYVARNASGQQLPGGIQTVTVDPDNSTGVFTVAFNVPAEAEEITVWVDLGSSGHNYARVQRVIDTTPGTLTTVTGWTVATRSISISGSVDTNDGPYANESLELVVQAYNGAIQIDGDYSSFVLTNGAGNYSAEIFLPAGTTRVVLDPQLPEQPPVTLQPIAGAVTTFTNVDFFTPGGVEVDVTMQMKINGSAMPASMFDLEVIGYTADDDGDGPFDVFAVSGEGTEVDYTPLGGGVFSASAFVSADAQFVTVQMTMAISGPPIVYKRTFAMQDLAPSYAVNLSLDHNTANRLHITGTSQVRNPDESGETSCAIEGEDVKFPFRVEVVALDAAPDDDPFETSVLDTIVLPSGSQFVPIDDSWDLITRVPSNTQWVELRFSTPYHEPQYVDANYAMADIYDGGIDLWQVLVDATCEGN